jgi:hypothetical protein
MIRTSEKCVISQKKEKERRSMIASDYRRQSHITYNSMLGGSLYGANSEKNKHIYIQTYVWCNSFEYFYPEACLNKKWLIEFQWVYFQNEFVINKIDREYPNAHASFFCLSPYWSNFKSINEVRINYFDTSILMRKNRSDRRHRY